MTASCRKNVTVASSVHTRATSPQNFTYTQNHHDFILSNFTLKLVLANYRIFDIKEIPDSVSLKSMDKTEGRQFALATSWSLETDDWCHNSGNDVILHLYAYVLT